MTLVHSEPRALHVSKATLRPDEEEAVRSGSDRATGCGMNG